MIKTLDITKEYPAPEYPKITSAVELRNGVVVRMPNHLGDTVMALPALVQLRKMLPSEFALTVVAPAYQKELFLALEDIVDSFIPLASQHKAWSLKEIKEVKKMHFGLGVLFNNSFRDALMLRLAGVPALAGSDRRMRKLLLTYAFAYPPRPEARAAEVHQANRLLEMVYALGAPKWDGTLPQFKSLSPEKCSADIADACKQSKLLTVSPGAAYGAAKRWPVSHFKQVCQHWIDEGGFVAIVGTPSEKAIAQELSANISPQSHIDLCGKTKLDELMTLIKSSAAVLANDSGIMHLGAALGKPGVAVFGPTDHTATGPISPLWKLVITEEKCGPCFKRVCPKNNPLCMLNITPGEVISALHELTNC